MTRFRVAPLLESRLAGLSLSAQPGHFSFQRGGAVAVAVTAIFLGGVTAALSGAKATSLACALLLMIGLPHGALDIAAIGRVASATLRIVIAAYVGAGMAMLAVWWASPLAGLAIFYLISVAHFADDWNAEYQPFFGHATAIALLSAPTFLHGDMLRQLFVALTQDARAARLVDLLILAAPVATAIALLGVVAMGSRQRSAEIVCALTAMVILPPVAGFAVFFCLFHSPRHFREGWTALGSAEKPRTAMLIAAMTLVSFGIAASIYAALEVRGADVALFQASMMTLSALAVPHMLLTTILKHTAPRATRFTGASRAAAG